MRATPSGNTPVSGAESPRVRVHPSPDGTVLIIGTTIDGRWVAEHRCRAERFGERHVRAMERAVLEEEGTALRILR